MPSGLRFFQCNVLGGFRLSDVHKNVKQGEYFYLDAHVAETSRAVLGALRERWMIEVTEKEASKHLDIPKHPTRKSGVETRKKVKIDVATPNVKEVNKNIESRQTENNKLNVSEVSVPDFKKVEEQAKERHEESTNNVGAATDSELLTKDTELLSVPKQSKKEEPEKVEEPKEEVKEPKVEIVEEKTVELTVNEEMFDNTGLSIPNLEEKPKTVKEEVKEKLENKISAKKRINRKRGRPKGSKNKNKKE